MKSMHLRLVGLVGALLTATCIAPAAASETIASVAGSGDVRDHDTTYFSRTSAGHGSPSNAPDLDPAEQSWQVNQKPLGDVAWRAETEFPDEFTFAYFAAEGQGMTIGFRDTAPSVITDALRATGLKFEVLEQLGYDASTPQNIVSQLSKEFSEFSGVESNIAVDSAPQLGVGTIRVSLFGGSEALARAVERRASDVSLPDGFHIVVNRGGDLIQPTGYNKAGGTWLRDDSGQLVCTSAFVVKSLTSSDLRVLTAGHCANNLWFYHPPSGISYAFDYRNGVVGAAGDIKFVRSAYMMDAWFHAAEAEGRPVLETRNAYANEQGVCRYGRGTNVRTCGALLYSDMSINIAYGTQTVLVGHQDVTGAAGGAGDSGGPVFGGNTAMGVISGGNSSVTTFTRISAAIAYTGTRVCREVVCS